jgi:hypothetical protein
MNSRSRRRISSTSAASTLTTGSATKSPSPAMRHIRDRPVQPALLATSPTTSAVPARDTPPRATCRETSAIQTLSRCRSAWFAGAGSVMRLL